MKLPVCDPDLDGDPVSEPKVLCVLTHYKRPRNVEIVIGAIRSQTHQCKIVVVDNHPPSSSSLVDPLKISDAAMDHVDDVWRFTENHGPPCRFAPAYMQHDCKYVYFHDEDLLPGPQAVESLVETAEKLDGKFATIGQIGRRFERQQNPKRKWMQSDLGRRWGYSTVDVPRSPSKLTAVDMTCRAHFVRADLMPSVLQFKWELLRKTGKAGKAGMVGGEATGNVDAGNTDIASYIGLHRHDDFLLCLGIQRATGYPSYLTPISTPGQSIQRRNIQENPPASGRPEHKTERSRFVREAMDAGWESLWEDAESELRESGVAGQHGGKS